jgi:hypothetical protein
MIPLLAPLRTTADPTRRRAPRPGRAMIPLLAPLRTTADPAHRRARPRRLPAAP